MKTGYTEASGHNLVTSAVRSGVRLIGVVLGAGSNPERDAHMAMLLDQGFEQMDVPPERRTTVASRMPSLVGTAHAATLAAQQIRPAAQHADDGGLDHPGRQLRQRKGGPRSRVERPPRRGWRRGADRTRQPARRTIWRAQVTGLTAAEAQGTCAALARHRSACTVLRPDQRQVASG